MKIKISVGCDRSFEFDGDTPFSDIRPLIDQWYEAVGKGNAEAQVHVNTLTERFGRLADGIDSISQKLGTIKGE